MMPSQDRDIDIRRQGCAGRITLHRPQALNALTHDMVLEIEAALLKWRNDNDIALIIIDAEGDRAFCAGGDIEKLYQTGKAGNFDYGRTFWTDEYRLNALIANYPKPYIAFMQGYVMGGGVGISCHGSHRIVCESTRIAMPECEIGLVPDVGGSHLLANAPGRLGEFLAMTGTRMKAADTIQCGFADSFIPQENWEELKSRLCDTGEIGAVADLAIDPGPSELAQLGNEVDPIFASGSALQCLQTLEMETETWAAAAVKSIRR
ncbi:MAG: enoyl-CoA hydratase/isomerase family protein, partial [Pseudomonadota bacterium]